ncbi:hypothetical protein BH23BAC1_BH23BAC1_12660 [soil metagenome]
MKQQFKFLLIALSTLIIVAFILFVFNQIMLVYTYTSGINEALGNAVLMSLSLLFLILFIVPIFLFFRLPKPLLPPESEEEKLIYKRKLGKRLANNKLLKEGNFNFQNESEIDRALGILKVKSDTIIHNTAKSIFLTTSISQNGKLDALTVFITQSKMVWDLAHLYYQRPAPKDMLALYANVGAATFLATEIEDLDFSEHLEPVFATMMQNTAFKSVPFVSSVTNVVMDSILEGTINAFLTLRVGVIARNYCGTMNAFNRRKARRAAFQEAAVMLRIIVAQSSGQVISAIVKATKRAGVNTAKSGLQAANRATANVRTGFTNLTNKLRRNPPIPDNEL